LWRRAMKPAVSHYGGKQRMARNIVPLLPKHTVYVEPFAGGAAVFFAKPWPDAGNNNHYREVLNDKCGDLINFYRVLQDEEKTAKLLRRLYFTPYSREICAERKQEPSDDVDRAAKYYCDLSWSFSNKRGGGWGASVYSRNSSATHLSRVADLWECAERLRGVAIEHDDALSVIKRWDSPQTLFYCDPPYPGAEQGHYSGYTQEDFARLCDVLDTCSGSFVLSCYDNTAARPHWERFEFSAHAAGSGKGRTGAGRDKTKANTEHEAGKIRTEVVWRVDRSHTVRPELRKLFDAGKFDCFGAGASVEVLGR
jgi:DNA adenine methylase